MNRTSAAFALSFVLFANVASAEAGFQFTAPSLRAPDDPNVNGMRLSLFHGKNESQGGMDLGMISLSESNHMSGLALIMGVHMVPGQMDGGVAFSLINVHKGVDSGVNGAFINLLNDASGAFNIGFVIIADGATMVDVGGFNKSKSSTAQLGFINMTDEIKSFQLGFLNMAKNGFFPMFPFINFPKD